MGRPIEEIARDARVAVDEAEDYLLAAGWESAGLCDTNWEVWVKCRPDGKPIVSLTGCDAVQWEVNNQRNGGG